MSILEKLAETNTLTPEQLERVSIRVQEFIKAAEQDPVLLREAKEKLAGKESFFNSVLEHGKDVLPRTLAMAGIAALLGAATDTGKHAILGLKDKFDKPRAFKNMVESNPSLKSHSEADLHKAFNTLHTFNPEFARDPWVAGTFVNNQLAMDRLDISTVSALVGAHKNAPQHQSSVDFFMNAAKISPRQTVKAENAFKEEETKTRHGLAMDLEDLKDKHFRARAVEGNGRK